MREKALEEAGWTMTCESPLEIEHSDGSAASGQAADIVIDYVVSEHMDDLIDEWHEGDGEKPLHEFLGMTISEYEQWLRATNR